MVTYLGSSDLETLVYIVWKTMIVAVPIANRISAKSPKRNQTARRRAWSVGWVMPKVRKKAVARASKSRIDGWYAVGIRWGGDPGCCEVGWRLKNRQRH